MKLKLFLLGVVMLIARVSDAKDIKTNVVVHPSVKANALAAVSLFRDMSFDNGFLLSYPSTKWGRKVADVLTYDNKNRKPLWRLAQWGTRYNLAGSKCQHLANGDCQYRNKGKLIIHGGPNSPNRDLVLAVFAKEEYDRPRKLGEGWPHLLIEQDTGSIISLDKLDRVDFHLALRLDYCKRYMSEKEYKRNLHTAQLQMFFVVKNINKASPDYKNYFWFGVPFFDYRYKTPHLYMALDRGKAGATWKFIYTIAGSELNPKPLQPGEWVVLQKNLLPYIIEGLQQGRSKKYLVSSNPADYAIVNMNLGWEVPGIFNVSATIRDLRIEAKLK